MDDLVTITMRPLRSGRWTAVCDCDWTVEAETRERAEEAADDHFDTQHTALALQMRYLS